MRLSFHTVALSLLVSLSFNNNDRFNLVEASKLRRGSVNENDEIEDMSEENIDERSLLSLGTLTDAELFALKKTPPGPLKSSKCGDTSLFRSLGSLRRQHPGCLQFEEEDTDMVPGTLPPIGAPTLSPPPTAMTPTIAPTNIQDRTLNCVQTVVGSEISIPYSEQFREEISISYLSYDAIFRQGDVLCLSSLEGENRNGGQEPQQTAYFGYNWSNEFGLFVNGESVWNIPKGFLEETFDHWTFEEDGNLAVRDASGNAIWTSQSHGNDGGKFKLSFDRVWIEDEVGDLLWSQPPYLGPPVPTDAPTSSPTFIHQRPLNCVQTVVGNDLTIPLRQYYKRGDVHCLISDDGEAAYFGYTWSNQFGLFVNNKIEWSAKWTAPDESVAASNRWVFQQDGNLLLRDSNNQGIWRTNTCCHDGSQLKMSMERVWIESNVGLQLWSEPFFATLGPSPQPTPPPTGLPTPRPTSSPTVEPPPSPAPTPGPTRPPTRPPTPGPSLPPTPGPTRPPTPPPTPGPTLPPTPGPTRPPTPPPTPGPTFRQTPPPTRPPTAPPTNPPTNPPTPPPTNPPTRPQDQSLRCVQNVAGGQITIPIDAIYRKGDVHCLRQGDGTEAYFGYTWSNQFGLFVNGRSVWTAPESQVASFDRWSFQGDGNLVLREGSGRSIWTTESDGNWNSHLRVTSERVWIERNMGDSAWSQPPYLGPSKPNNNNDNNNNNNNNGRPNNNSGLQYYAYYYPWYLRNNWGRHDYQDEPLLGKYGTDEVAVAEQHIEWALETGIASWIVSYWGPNHLTMKHFKAGMMRAPSLNKMKFCMLYESVALDGRGNWRDGSREEALYQDLKVIRDEFMNHPSYLKINGRPVIIFYITRSRMPYEGGFDGPAVLANIRRRLGRDIYFIADEPFFDYNNQSPNGNRNAFKDGKQVFDAYTTYNMFQDSRVRRGETATDYQLRESMPVWKRWAEQVPLFPNVMPQYYDFRGHKPLMGNSADFMKQLRAVACLPRKNFNGAPHIMMVTSFNEWWEGTQIEPENGSGGNWNNYGFQFMETLAAFKKEVDSRGTYWC